MKRIPFLGVVLVAFTAFVGSASAALPEFYAGISAYTGTHAFTGAGGPTTRTGEEFQVKCSASTSKGKVKGPKDVEKMRIKYTGCTAVSGMYSCGTAGKITTNPLKGELVYGTEELLPAPHYVALLLEPEVAGKPWATFKCSGFATKIKWEGSLLARMTPTNSSSHTAEPWLEEKVTEPEAGCGLQRLLNVEGTPPCHNLVSNLVSFAFSHAIWVVGHEILTYGGSTFALEIRG
jgi:hypothetical protein